MAENKLLGDTATQNVIDDNAALSDGSRAAGDYDNSTELDLECIAYLTVQFDSTAPSVNTIIAELYALPGDGAGTEVFPEGGDAGLGTNDDPQALFFVGAFETINPSISADEVLAIPNVPLYPDTVRFVIKNVSGQQFDSTWQLDIKPQKLQTA